MTNKLKLSELRLNGSTQVRVAIDQVVVAEYAEALKAGKKIPPITVYFDGQNYWLANGFNQYHGCVKAGIDEIEVELINWTLRDLILCAVGANATHGLRRSNADTKPAPTSDLQPAAGTQAPPTSEIKQQSSFRREEISDRTMRQVLEKGGADFSQHVLKRAMCCNRWFSLTKEPLPSDPNQVTQILVITMPETLQPDGLETLAACARKLNCGVFVNRSLHEVLSTAVQSNDLR